MKDVLGFFIGRATLPTGITARFVTVVSGGCTGVSLDVLVVGGLSRGVRAGRSLNVLV